MRKDGPGSGPVAAANGRLHELEGLDWDPRPAVCVVMASEGYPGNYEKGRPISGLEDADAVPDVKVFHAGTAEKQGMIVNTGGRVLGVTALGHRSLLLRPLPTQPSAGFSGRRLYRRDIANKCLSAPAVTPASAAGE